MMKKRKIILSIIMVMLVICTLLSVSYAFYTINAGDQIAELGTETIIPSCADAPLSGGTIVALKNDNSSPVSDAKALNSGDTYRYSFSITNGCTTNYKIKIALAPSVNSTMPYRAIKYALIERNASIPTTGKYLIDLTEEELSSDIVREVYEQTSIDVETGFAILDATLSANETKDYYLYVWVDYYEGDRTSTGVYNNSTTDTMFTANLVVTGYEDLGLNLLAYAVYSETDNSLTFYKNFDEVVAGNEYNGKIATKVYTGIETDVYTVEYESEATKSTTTPWYEYANAIKTVSIEDEIAPISTAGWFFYLTNVENIDLTNLDTSQVNNMSHMFNNAGYNSASFVLDLGDKFNTENVTNMTGLFSYTGQANSTFKMDLSQFIVQSSCDLTDFAYGSSASFIFGEGWSNATLVSGMFGYGSSTPIEIVNAPANILAYDFAADNRVVTFTTI